MQLDPSSLRLVARTSGDPREIQSAVWSMANRMKLDESDVYVLLELLGRTPPVHDDVLKTVLWALSLRPDAVPVATFARIAESHPTAGVRNAALRTIGNLPGEGCVTTLSHVAHNDESPQNRQEAVFFLSLQLPSEGALESARDSFTRESDPSVRSAWVHLIGSRTDTGRSGKILWEILRTSDEATEVRRTAAELIVAGDPSSFAALSNEATLPEEIREHVRLMASAMNSPDPVSWD